MKKIIFIAAFLSLFVSCSSVPRFKGNGDLCGIIVDENNQPIEDFIVYCSSAAMMRQAVFTNDSGIFVFHDMPGGKYKISGKKNDYVRLEGTDYLFTERGKIFCAQVLEINAALDKTEQLIKLEDLNSAKETLKSIEVEWGSNEKNVVNQYMTFVNKKLKEKKNEKKILHE